MNAKKFKWVGISIISLILITAIIQSIQIYENYQENLEAYHIDVQEALDNSVESYFTELAQTDVLTFADAREFKVVFDIDSMELDSNRNQERTFFQRFSSSELPDQQAKIFDGKHKNGTPLTIDSIEVGDISHISYFSSTSSHNGQVIDSKNEIIMLKGKQASDSISAIKELANKIVISITRDTVDFSLLQSHLQENLEKKNLNIDFAFYHYKKDSLTGSFTTVENDLPFETKSKASILPSNQELRMEYENASLIILRKGMGNIVFSLFFLALVVFILLYLFSIIKSQKALSEIKNDLISNITHEFKTPIATVSTAIEGIKNFNKLNDPAKTDKYLDISNQQLLKLNQMVEKLLETASMEKEELVLEVEPINLLEIINQLSDKYKTIYPEKRLSLDIHDVGTLELDRFHFENAISNIVDNAFKYGGDHISISLSLEKQVALKITDNGQGIPLKEQERIFEKFYRINQGNVHNVKGFGIGLYYTKTIIEKHGGKIQLKSYKGNTTFKITLA